MKKILEPLLGVNIDHIATIRQNRLTRYPDPVQAAFEAEMGGADSITVHLREDRRHIQDRDVEQLAQLLTARLNLEMAVTDEMADFACRIKPADCCLVPERRAELTTEGGLNVIAHFDRIKALAQKLGNVGISVSLFIDPDEQQISAAARTGAPKIEIHTGHYCNTQEPGLQQQELQKIILATRLAVQLGFQVNAGHGLHYHNVQSIAAIPDIKEFNIGHSIVSRSIFCGLKTAVREMKNLLLQSRSYS